MQTTINGIRMEYDVLGKGEPILLVHGWNGRKESLRPLGNLLSENYEVYLIDLPGFGSSSIPPDDWGADQYVHTVKEFIKAKKLSCLNYVGHSFGGGIGIKLAFDNSSLIKNLVLISAAFHRDPVNSKASRFVNKIPFYDKAKYHLVFPRRAYYKVFHPRSDALKNPELERIFRNIIKEDLRDLIPKLNSRTLVLWGESDHSTPLSDAYFLRDNISDVTVKIFKGEAHNLPIASPDKVYKEIVDFIKT